MIWPWMAFLLILFYFDRVYFFYLAMEDHVIHACDYIT